MTEVTRNGDELWGMVLSGMYLYSQEEPIRYIVIIYSMFESFKAIISKKVGNITCPITHLSKRAGFFLLSGLKYCMGLWKIRQFREKNYRNRKPTNKAQFWLYLFKGKVGYTCFAIILATKATKLALVLHFSTLIVLKWRGILLAIDLRKINVLITTD